MILPIVTNMITTTKVITTATTRLLIINGYIISMERKKGEVQEGDRRGSGEGKRGKRKERKEREKIREKRSRHCAP